MFCPLAACDVAPSDDFPDFYLVNTCEVTIEASAPVFSDPLILEPGQAQHLVVNRERMSLRLELRANGVAYDSVTGVSPLRIVSCPPTS